MAKYIVKTINDRNQVIEADRFSLRSSSTYEFIAGGNLVASVPAHNVFAIVQWDADISDYYFSDHDLDDNFNRPFSGHSNLARSANSPEDDTDDVCIDCRNEELFDSQEFFNAVADVFYALTEPDDEESNPPEPSNHATAPKVEKRFTDMVEYGFVTPKGWVGFSDEKSALEGAQQYANGHTSWAYTPIEKTQVIQ